VCVRVCVCLCVCVGGGEGGMGGGECVQTYAHLYVAGGGRRIRQVLAARAV
jgi:hypothetical protein